MSYLNMIGLAVLAMTAPWLESRREFWIAAACFLGGLLTGQVPRG